jgi:hypothetical protein
MKSQGMPTEDPQPQTDERPGEDPRPTDLRSQEIPTATLTSLPPRAREQALPEKDDDRFFDRWVVDKAQDLGMRAVKRPAVKRLQDATQAFAEWRSLRHKPAATRTTMDDRVLVASTDEAIGEAEAEAERLTHKAAIAESRSEICDAEVEAVAKERSALRPALRGGGPDIGLVVLANFVVLAVDVFIIHLALGRIPGDPREFWYTALTMGAGAVVIGDVLGWMAAAGTVRKDGTIGRPARSSIVAVAGLLVLAVWFFVELGEFRAEALLTIGKRDELEFGDPNFFTIAQILFLLGAAAASFSYVARSHGRELLDRHGKALKQRDVHRGDAASLRNRAELARATAAAAPRLRKRAQERIKAHEQIAKDDAALDIKQGKYLQALIDPEYARERADVESGVRFWQFETQSASEMPAALRWALGVIATLAGGGIAYWVSSNIMFVVITAVVVATGYTAMTAWGGSADEEDAATRERHQRYVAKLVAEARVSDERATDIECLEPVPPPVPRSGGGAEAGNGHRKGQQAHDEYKKLLEEERSSRV